jgi:hypothetical protein
VQRPQLTGDQLAAVTRIIAALDGAGPDLPDVREISRDRLVLGDVLGDYLHRVVVGAQSETARYWPVLELLRAAGADEERAAAKATWLRTSAPAG